MLTVLAITLSPFAVSFAFAGGMALWAVVFFPSTPSLGDRA